MYQIRHPYTYCVAFFFFFFLFVCDILIFQLFIYSYSTLLSVANSYGGSHFDTCFIELLCFLSVSLGMLVVVSLICLSPRIYAQIVGSLL